MPNLECMPVDWVDIDLYCWWNSDGCEIEEYLRMRLDCLVSEHHRLNQIYIILKIQKFEIENYDNILSAYRI